MRIKAIIVLAVFVSISSVGVAGSWEQAIGIRPGQLFFDHNRNAGTISDGSLDQVVGFGWGGTTGAMADFNGDGLDDKTLYQPSSGGWQTIVSYTGIDGDISGTNLDVIAPDGGGEWGWLDNTNSYPIYGDVDGDGIADNGLVSDGISVFNDPNDWLVWGAWLSDGVPGVALGGAPFTNWSVFGVASLDIGLMGDINGDGYDDRVIYRPSASQAWVNYSVAGNYGPGSIDGTIVAGGPGDEMALADINGDGYDDVVIIRPQDPLGDPNNSYDLFGYYSSAAGFGAGGIDVDIIGTAGFLDAGDYIVFGDIEPEAADNTLAERVSPYRAGHPGLFYSHANDLAYGGGWVDMLDKTGWHGWTGIIGAAWPDFNGDGNGDKTVWQSVGAGHQIIVSWTSADGDISDGDWAGNGDIEVSWNWGTNPADKISVFGDLDGDGIDDNCLVTTDFDLNSGDPNIMLWGAWVSGGFTGIPDGVRGSTFFGGFYGSFGLYSLDTPFLGDINGDGHEDRILYRSSTYEVFVDYSEPTQWGDGIVDELITLGGIAGDKLGVTDINGDGYDDLVIIRFDPGMHPDAYSLYGWYTDPAVIFDNIDGLFPDQITIAGTVSEGDEILFAQIYSAPPTPVFSKADLDRDGDVDNDDLGRFIEVLLTSGHGIENPSFEDDPAVDPNIVSFYFNGNTHPDFDHLNIPKHYAHNGMDGVIYNPGSSEVIQPTDGDNVIYSYGGGNIAQFVGGYCTAYKLEADALYTITVDVTVDETWDTIGGSYWVNLNALCDDCAGGFCGINTLASVVESDIPPVVNEWTTVELTVDMSDFPEYADGNNILLLGMQGVNVYYDNLTFFSTVFPDFNNDNIINLVDFSYIAGEWTFGL